MIVFNQTAPGNKGVPEPKPGYEQRKVSHRKYSAAKAKGWERRVDDNGKVYDDREFVLCERPIKIEATERVLDMVILDDPLFGKSIAASDTVAFIRSVQDQNFKGLIDHPTYVMKLADTALINENTTFIRLDDTVSDAVKPTNVNKEFVKVPIVFVDTNITDKAVKTFTSTEAPTAGKEVFIDLDDIPSMTPENIKGVFISGSNGSMLLEKNDDGAFVEVQREPKKKRVKLNPPS